MAEVRTLLVKDGEQALQYVRRKGRYPRLDSILLDLNLPRMDCRQVLEEIKADPALPAPRELLCNKARGSP